MRALVTGAAGFIGSNLVDRLLVDGHDVVGIDSFSPYYDRVDKLANLATARRNERFRLVEGDLCTEPLEPLLADVDVVFHQAGQPGVRLSWADGFEAYARDNIAATQRLLEGIRANRAGQRSVGRVVFASSSSVYGNAERYPTVETDLPHPYSPYGVTKLAAEHLCFAYEANFGIPAVALRYFTVYGPRQRPDMAIHRLIEAACEGTSFPLYAAGDFVRTFTFVGDIVEANLSAATIDTRPGSVINIAGGSSIVMHELVALVSELVGAPIAIEQLPAAPGDARENGGAIDVARDLLGWSPSTSLRDGIAAQVDWHRSRP